MIKINVKPTLGNVIARLEHLKADIPKAAAKALTETARAIERAEQAEMRRVFDRPKEFTLRSLFVKPATARNLTATVGLKNFAGKGTAAARYLYAQIHGGSRSLKRFERALQHAGVLPNGMYAVPGAAARLDAYGNISQGQIIQILSQLRAQRVAGYSSNMTAATKVRAIRRAGGQFFVGRPGGGSLPLGVWQRRGFLVAPVLIFVKAPQYQQRFRFYEVAQRTVDRVFHQEFEKALREETRG